MKNYESFLLEEARQEEKKRPIHYRTKSLKYLFEIFSFENGRESTEDAEITKRYVVNEIYARVKESIDWMEAGADVEEAYYNLIKD